MSDIPPLHYPSSAHRIQIPHQKDNNARTSELTGQIAHGSTSTEGRITAQGHGDYFICRPEYTGTHLPLCTLVMLMSWRYRGMLESLRRGAIVSQLECRWAHLRSAEEACVQCPSAENLTAVRVNGTSTIVQEGYTRLATPITLTARATLLQLPRMR
jgi:hypothetical protein